MRRSASPWLRGADAIICAFAIGGAVNAADVSGSGTHFRKLWRKWLDAPVLEAIAESHRESQISSDTGSFVDNAPD